MGNTARYVTGETFEGWETSRKDQVAPSTYYGARPVKRDILIFLEVCISISGKKGWFE